MIFPGGIAARGFFLSRKGCRLGWGRGIPPPFSGLETGEACVARCGTGFASLRGGIPGGRLFVGLFDEELLPAVFIVLDDDAAVGIDEIEVEFFDHGVGRKTEEILRVEVFLETGTD